MILIKVPLVARRAPILPLIQVYLHLSVNYLRLHQKHVHVVIKPGRFSFNVKGGRCEACEGDGVIKVEMHFLADVYVTCDVCKGKRYNRETLEILYKGKNIHEVLEMTVEEARVFFDPVPVIARKLQTLIDVGLSYICLGQSATTLSGGEAQRVKLARELSRRDTGKPYIF